MKIKKRPILIIAYYVVYSLIYSGWLLHKSIKPVVFNYSLTYFFFLVAMALFFLLPGVISFYVQRLGRKGLGYSLVGMFGLLFTLHMFAAIHYYYTQRHLFDPFLQNSLKSPLDPKMTGADNNTYRILCIGGSTTANKALNNKDSYPKVLERILRERYPHKKIEVFNGGRGWYTTKHSLIGYVTYYSDWNPDLVIVMHAINDICRSFSPPEYAIGEYNDLWTHFYGASINGARPPTFEQHILKKFEIPINAWYAEFRSKEKDYPVERYISLGVFENNLKKIIRYARHNKSKVVIVSQPSLYKEKMNNDELSALYFGKTIANERISFMRIQYPSARSFLQAMELFNETAKKIALSEDAIIVDAAGKLEKSLENFRDDLHYTKNGAESLARVVAGSVIEKGLLVEK